MKEDWGQGERGGGGDRSSGIDGVVACGDGNMRRLSVRETNRSRLVSVAVRVRQERWEMVLLTELKVDKEGVVWLGEGEERVVLIYGKKAGVMLRGEAIEKWVEGGGVAEKVVWGEGGSCGFDFCLCTS